LGVEISCRFLGPQPVDRDFGRLALQLASHLHHRIANLNCPSVQRAKSETYAAYRLAISGGSEILRISDLRLNPHTVEKIKVAKLNKRTFSFLDSGFVLMSRTYREK
jgi:hypothetical protein